MVKSAPYSSCLVAIVALASAPFVSSVSLAASGFACSVAGDAATLSLAANPTVFVISPDTAKFVSNGSLVVLEEGDVLKSAQANSSAVSKYGATYAFELDGKALSLEIILPVLGCGRGSCDLNKPVTPVAMLTNADGVQVKYKCSGL